MRWCRTGGTCPSATREECGREREREQCKNRKHRTTTNLSDSPMFCAYGLLIWIRILSLLMLCVSSADTVKLCHRLGIPSVGGRNGLLTSWWFRRFRTWRAGSWSFCGYLDDSDSHSSRIRSSYQCLASCVVDTARRRPFVRAFDKVADAGPMTEEGSIFCCRPYLSSYSPSQSSPGKCKL